MHKNTKFEIKTFSVSDRIDVRASQEAAIGPTACPAIVGKSSFSQNKIFKNFWANTF